MLRVGLTGGIGCGKTTVAKMMRELGCHIIEADKLAHQLIEPGGAAYDAVVREFGREILMRNDVIDPGHDALSEARVDARDNAHTAAGTGPRISRSRVAAIVFADPARLARLNSIVHPPLLAVIDRELDRLAAENPHGIAVIDAALLIEFGHYKTLDPIVIVTCKPEQQLGRLTDATLGRGMTREQAQSRIASQLSTSEKRKLADYEIDCSGTLEETRRQVVSLVEKLKSRAAKPSSADAEQMNASIETPKRPR